MTLGCPFCSGGALSSVIFASTQSPTFKGTEFFFGDNVGKLGLLCSVEAKTFEARTFVATLNLKGSEFSFAAKTETGEICFAAAVVFFFFLIFTFLLLIVVWYVRCACCLCCGRLNFGLWL